MSLKTWCILWISLLNGSILMSQDLLQGSISTLPQKLTYLQIVDTLNAKYQIQFSNDASLVTDTLQLFSIEPTITAENWLNSTFATDSSEWILLDNQVIIRRKKSIKIVKESQHYFEFRGRVVSNKKEPISFASISLAGTNLGTVTNANGEFEFSTTTDSSTITISASSLGYNPTIVQQTSSSNNILIELQESVTQLPEVSIALVNVNTILHKVIERREENYPNYPTMLTGFFRESILKKERYIDVTEAMIALNKPSYTNDFASERVMVEKVRRYKDTVNLGEVNLRLEGGPFHFSKLDVVRTADFLPPATEPSLYKYFFEGYDTEYGKDVYVVSFKPIIDYGDLLYVGTMYIDVESYALTSIKFQLSDGAIKKSKKFFVQSESNRTKTLPISAKYQVYYRPYQGQWVISYVRGELTLKISSKKRRINSNFTAISELAITEANMGKYTILRDGYVKSSYILSEHVSQTSPLFWHDYNVIPPLKEVRMLFEEKEDRK